MALSSFFPFVLISLQNKEQNNESQFFFIDRQIMHNLLIYNPIQPNPSASFVFFGHEPQWIDFHISTSRNTFLKYKLYSGASQY